MLIDHTNRRVLDVLESREKEAVVKWLKENRESGLLSAVEEVTCDMWDGYVEAAKEVFGPAGAHHHSIAFNVDEELPGPAQRSAA